MADESQIYELGYLLNSAEAEATVLGILSQHQATIINQGKPVDTTLAYAIKKHLSAYFGFVQFNAVPSAADAIKKEVGLQKSVLRSLLFCLQAKALKSQERPAAKPPRSSKPEVVTSAPAKPQILSNEALSEKLEEILKWVKWVTFRLS